jgi:hypothetical protein
VPKKARAEIEAQEENALQPALRLDAALQTENISSDYIFLLIIDYAIDERRK